MFIKSLIARGLKPKNLHLIGHSLGCHVAGLAAKHINRDYENEIDLETKAPFGKIGRISAMDPAQPLYHDVPSQGTLMNEKKKITYSIFSAHR